MKNAVPSHRGLEFSVAWRYLRSRRGSRLLSLISVIAIGGVLVGVAALTVIMGVMNGLQRDLRDKILVGSPDVRVLPVGERLQLSEWQPLVRMARETPGVAAAAPFAQTQGLVTSRTGFSTGAQVVGLEPGDSEGNDVTTIRETAILGEFSFIGRDGRANGAVVGRTLAANLNVFEGDTILLLGFSSVQYNAATGLATGYTPDTFVVTGLFETGMYEYDNAYIYVSLEAGQRFAALGNDVTGIEVRSIDRNAAPQVADSLSARLGTSIRTVDWQQQNAALFQALKLEKLGMGVILGLIIMIAAFNIISTLTMVVSDKTREIGILRAMGLPAKSIRRIFLWQGVVIGAVGTAGGVMLGLGVSYVLQHVFPIPLNPEVYFIDRLPVFTEYLEVVYVAIASVVVAALATIYPAGQAARLYPVEAIRHD